MLKRTDIVSLDRIELQNRYSGEVTTIKTISPREFVVVYRDGTPNRVPMHFSKEELDTFIQALKDIRQSVE